jgi:tyrosyl-tRNA synthetase
VSAQATAAQTFGAGGMGDDLPVLEIPADGLRIGAALTALGFTASNGEAKRKLAEGAVKLDDQPVSDETLVIQLATGTERKLSLGRKKHAILRGA